MRRVPLFLASVVPLLASTALADDPPTPARAAETSAEETTDASSEGVDQVDVHGARTPARVPPPVEGTEILAGKKITRTSLDELPVQPTNSLRQLLALTPGLVVSEVTNQAWASISYRGLGEPHESWNLLLLRDGLPIVPDMYSYPAGYVQPPFESIARVDFVRGGASLLYGPQPGGALNFVSREPASDRRLVLTARGIGGSYGLFQLYGGVDGSVPAADGKTHTSYLLDFQRSALEGMRPNSDALSTSGSAFARFDISDRQRITVRLDTFDGEFGEPGGLTGARYDQDRTLGSTPLDRIRLQRLAPSARYELKLGANTTLEARVFAGHFDRTSRRQAGTSFGVDANPANVSVVQSQRFWTLGTQARLRHDYVLGGATQTMTIGTQVFGSYAPVRVDKGLSSLDWQGLGAALVRSERRGQIVSLFGEHMFTFGRARIVPGVRFELIRQNVAESLDLQTGSATDGRVAGAPNGAASSGSSTEPVFLPGIGASYSFDAGIEPYVNVVRGYKPKLYNDAFTFQSGVNVTGSFNPTYTLSSELGVRGRPVPWLSFDASAFHITFDDQVGFFANDQGGATRGNVGSMRNRGLDFAAEVDAIGALMDLARGSSGERDGRVVGRSDARRGPGSLTFFGNVSLLDARLTSGPSEGTRPQYAPTHLVRTGVFYRWGSRVKIAFLGTVLGRHNGSDNAHPLFDIPAYQVWDLSFELRIPGTEIALLGGLNNLFDARYYARVRPGGSGGIDPAFGRNFFVGATGRL